MSALDALLCYPKEKKNKDKLIARRLVSFNAHVRGVPDKDLESWFRPLYGRWRNNASHDGRFYTDEREVIRLLELSEAAVRWAIWHLDPDHRVPVGSCATIADAHRIPHDDED